MRARRMRELEYDMWEVRHGDAWWTVHFPDDGTGPHILNAKLVAIKPTGRLGKSLLSAVACEREAGR